MQEIQPGATCDSTSAFEPVVINDASRMYTAELSALPAQRRFMVDERNIALSQMFSTTGLLVVDTRDPEALTDEVVNPRRLSRRSAGC